MAQRDRYDEPGAFHHVCNRGIAKRTVFESRRDCRFFLARLARAARLGLIEIHAFCILTTHFHLLLRSPEGEMWRGMQRAQNAFVRRFNMQRRRDGPLFRGRFRSKRVRSEAYFRNLVRYIDANAVAAGLVGDASQYAWGSARLYVNSRRPRWLTTERVVDCAMELTGAPTFTSDGYSQAFGTPPNAGLVHVFERRLELTDGIEDPIDDLYQAAPASVLEWMRRKAALADGSRPGLPVCAPETVIDVVRDRRAKADGEEPTAGPDAERTTRSLTAGLLRALAGVTLAEVARRLRCTPPTAASLVRVHARSLEQSEAFAREAADCIVACVERDWGADVGRGRHRDHS